MHTGQNNSDNEKGKRKEKLPMSSNNGNKSAVVVITGASAGVARATAQAFAKRGARIGLIARGKDGLEGARVDVENAGGDALAIPTDVARSDEVEAAAEAIAPIHPATSALLRCQTRDCRIYRFLAFRADSRSH